MRKGGVRTIIENSQGADGRYSASREKLHSQETELQKSVEKLTKRYSVNCGQGDISGSEKEERLYEVNAPSYNEEHVYHDAYGVEIGGGPFPAYAERSAFHPQEAVGRRASYIGFRRGDAGGDDASIAKCNEALGNGVRSAGVGQGREECEAPRNRQNGDGGFSLGVEIADAIFWSIVFVLLVVFLAMALMLSTLPADTFSRMLGAIGENGVVSTILVGLVSLVFYRLSKLLGEIKQSGKR